MSQYEVWCRECDVSFPPATKRCMHCGGRIQKERPAKYLGNDERFSVGTAASESPVMTAEDEEQLIRFSAEPEGAEEQVESPGRRGLRASMSIVWMVLLAAGYIWQNCAGEG
jgi:hypothetical protein